MTLYQSQAVIEFACPYDVNVSTGTKLSQSEVRGLQRVTQFALEEHVGVCLGRANLGYSPIVSTICQLDNNLYQIHIDIDTIRCPNDDAIHFVSKEITDLANEKLTIIDIATAVNIDILSCAMSISEKVID